MTKSKRKRPSPTFPGLKAMLMAGSMSVSLVGARMLAINDVWHEAFQPEPTAVPTTPPTIPPTAEPGLDLSNLGAIPTAVAPYVVATGQPPTEVAAADPQGNAAPGNPPPQPQANAAPAEPAAGDGGGGGGGGGSRSS
jgi:hypothetical protein